jgi:redox-sensitive bicupin YhaK (pirin superfamily)
MTNPTNLTRPVVRVVHGTPVSDGAGVQLQRLIGSAALPQVDPFLLLDEIRSDQPGDYLAGFPDHPHRGFETVTYMLAGHMRHADNKGNRGVLRAGSVQWMTAGRGIVHSEMPGQEDGLLWGYQLWVNLPAAQKLTAPRYQDIDPERIPEVEREGARVRVVAGRFADVTGPVHGVATDPVFLDVSLGAGGRFEHVLSREHAAFVVMLAGSAQIPRDAGRKVGAGELALLGAGDRVEIAAESPARALLIAGRPLREPIARYGPFVMNTRAELLQALHDYEAGRF